MVSTDIFPVSSVSLTRLVRNSIESPKKRNRTVIMTNTRKSKSGKTIARKVEIKLQFSLIKLNFSLEQKFMWNKYTYIKQHLQFMQSLRDYRPTIMTIYLIELSEHKFLNVN